MGDMERVFLFFFLRKDNIICGGFPRGTAVKNPRAVQEIGFNPWVRMIPPREENGKIGRAHV